MLLLLVNVGDVNERVIPLAQLKGQGIEPHRAFVAEQDAQW
jgi:hypothetical protein